MNRRKDEDSTADPEFERITQNFRDEVAYDPNRTLEDLQKMRRHSEDGKIRTWSFSTLKDFESCRYRVFLAKIIKLPRDEPGPALLRGTRVHDELEKFVTGEQAELPAEAHRFEVNLNHLRDLYNTGVVEIEEDWGFTKEWESCSWKAPDLWAKMKLDAIHHDGEHSCVVIDYKTGKKVGNELKHMDQGIVYAIGAMMKYPKKHFFQVEFWYIDDGGKLIKKFTRTDLMMILPRLEERAYSLTTASTFPPVPSRHNCRWCPYARNKSCDYAEA